MISLHLPALARPSQGQRRALGRLTGRDCREERRSQLYEAFVKAGPRRHPDVP